jgi:hypothetical protein
MPMNATLDELARTAAELNAQLDALDESDISQMNKGHQESMIGKGDIVCKVVPPSELETLWRAQLGLSPAPTRIGVFKVVDITPDGRLKLKSMLPCGRHG